MNLHLSRGGVLLSVCLLYSQKILCPVVGKLFALYCVEWYRWYLFHLSGKWHVLGVWPLSVWSCWWSCALWCWRCGDVMFVIMVVFVLVVVFVGLCCALLLLLMLSSMLVL